MTTFQDHQDQQDFNQDFQYMKNDHLPTKFMVEYHEKIAHCIGLDLQKQFKLYMSLGVDPNQPLSDWFLMSAFYYKNLDIIQYLLDIGCTIRDLQTDCSKGVHSNAVLQYLSFNHNDYNKLDVVQMILSAYSSDKAKQDELLFEPCSSCGKNAIEFIFDGSNSIHLTLEHIYTLLERGCSVPASIHSYIIDRCIIYREQNLLQLMLSTYNIMVTAAQVSYALFMPNNKYKPYPQSIIIQLIDCMPCVYMSYRNTRYKNVFHSAVYRGDIEIVLRLLEKEGAMESFTTDSVIQCALQNGVIDISLLLFQFILHHKLETVGKATHESWYDITFQKAQLQFYNFLQEQVNATLVSYQPTMNEDKKEKIGNKISLLVSDFYHESGIGSPDQGTEARTELLGLYSDEKIKETIHSWSQTNPLAAMRWWYVEQEKRKKEEIEW
jgi:hypothetical protein